MKNNWFVTDYYGHLAGHDMSEGKAKDLASRLAEQEPDAEWEAMKGNDEVDLEQELFDDATSHGGIDHAGETLREFLESVDLPFDTPLEKINEALVECGIEPILAN